MYKNVLIFLHPIAVESLRSSLKRKAGQQGFKWKENNLYELQFIIFKKINSE